MIIEDLRKFYLLVITIHFLRTAYHSNSIFELAKTGAMSIPVFLAFVIGSACLFLGALRYFLKKKSKDKLFFIAFIGLGISLPFLLKLPHRSTFLELLFLSPASFAAYAMLFAAAGWWLNREALMKHSS